MNALSRTRRLPDSLSSGAATDTETLDTATLSVAAPRRSPGDSQRPRVLVVEDEQDLQDLIRFNLEREGFEALSVINGDKALSAAKAEAPDLILLDLMLPGMDGLSVCRALKADPDLRQVPIMMVTAKGEEADIIVGLELGADDYIVKPFSPRVLLARIKAVMRRNNRKDAPADTEPDTIRLGDLHIHRDRHEVRQAGSPVELTATEFRLLYLLASRPGRVFTRQQIIQSVHGGLAAVTDRSVDVQVVALRRKLDDKGQIIQTVRGVGYRFKE